MMLGLLNDLSLSIGFYWLVFFFLSNLDLGDKFLSRKTIGNYTLVVLVPVEDGIFLFDLEVLDGRKLSTVTHLRLSKPWWAELPDTCRYSVKYPDTTVIEKSHEPSDIHTLDSQIPSSQN